MATGFAAVQRNNVNNNPGYKTLFERVNERTGGEKKSLSWYRSAVRAELVVTRKTLTNTY